jgi:hypothetical protein
MPDSLRGQILRLAVEDAELRPRLVRLLREAGGLSEEEERTIKRANAGLIPGQPQPIVIQQVVNSGPPLPAGQPVGIITSPVLPVAPPAAPPPVPAPAPAVTSPNQSPLGIPGPGAAPAAPISALFVPERAQHGFNAELVPEMNKLLASGMTKAQVARDMLTLLRSSFAKKDTLYNILIRYQSSFESNEEYLGNLESLIESWATSTDGV